MRPLVDVKQSQNKRLLKLVREWRDESGKLARWVDNPVTNGVILAKSRDFEKHAKQLEKAMK